MAEMLEQIIEAAEALGAAGPLAEARRYLAQAGRLADDLVSQRTQAERDRVELISALSEGGITITDVLTRAVAAAGWEFDSPGSKVAVAARAACLRRAEAAGPPVGPTLFAVAVTIVDDVVDRSFKRSQAIPAGVVDAQTAVAAGHGQRWTDLAALLDRWNAAHALARLLAEADWIPGYDNRDDPRQMFARYEHPERLPAEYWQMPGPLMLATAVKAKARPGLYAARDAAGRLRAARAAVTQQKAAGMTQPGGLTFR